MRTAIQPLTILTHGPVIAATVIAATVMLLLPAQSRAFESQTCKVKTNDVGTIIGRGSSPDAAFEDAATQCFERRAKLYQLKKGTASLDEDSGMVMIDLCANVTCG